MFTVLVNRLPTIKILIFFCIIIACFPHTQKNIENPNPTPV